MKEEASKVPGVSTVDMLVSVRPDYIAPLKPIVGDESNPRPEPAPASP
jgi:hypothetical protein